MSVLRGIMFLISEKDHRTAVARLGFRLEYAAVDPPALPQCRDHLWWISSAH